MSEQLPSTSRSNEQEGSVPRLRPNTNPPQRPLPITLFGLGAILSTEEKVIAFCMDHGLIPRYGTCPSCESRLEPYRRVQRTGRPPYYRFQCRKRECRQGPSPCEVNLKKGTWFEGSKVSMEKSVILVYCFAHNMLSHETLKQMSLTEHTLPEMVADFYSYCREVRVENIHEGSDAKQIGGPNFTVEIVEAKFGKQKFNCGRIVEGQWVLGGICRETKECFLVPVEDRTENTLMSLIKRHVRQGLVIHTDCFPSYNHLSSAGYTHLTVNHSENFVDPDTGACTNLIESTWWAVRCSLPSNCARKKAFPLHLAEYIWRRTTHRSDDDIFYSFLHAISEVYQGPSK